MTNSYKKGVKRSLMISVMTFFKSLSLHQQIYVMQVTSVFRIVTRSVFLCSRLDWIRLGVSHSIEKMSLHILNAYSILLHYFHISLQHLEKQRRQVIETPFTVFYSSYAIYFTMSQWDIFRFKLASHWEVCEKHFQINCFYSHLHWFLNEIETSCNISLVKPLISSYCERVERK